MPRDTRVFVIAEDLFARNWISLLLVRDWRTRLVGDAGSLERVVDGLKNAAGRIDLILIDTEISHNEPWMAPLLDALHSFAPSARVLLTGLKPDERLLRQSMEAQFTGYILKDEICHSLVWACVLGAEGKWVITPGLQPLVGRMGLHLRRDSVMLDGRRTLSTLTDREIAVVRQAILFSVERYDLADELAISQDWTYGLVSGLYKKLGLEEILSGEVDPSIYLGQNRLVLDHVKGILERFKGSKKAVELESLAFHLITTPEIEEIS
jgi:DNA-binding NarL/FixJ family response regulator